MQRKQSLAELIGAIDRSAALAAEITAEQAALLTSPVVVVWLRPHYWRHPRRIFLDVQRLPQR